jgi:hypothetical protein
MEIAERIDGGGNEPTRTLEGADVLTVDDGTTTGGDDLVNDLLRGSCIAARTVHRRTEIVDDHCRAVTSEAQRVFPTDSATRTGDNHHATFTQLRHCLRLLG